MGRPSQEPRDAVRAQNVARILALMCQQHMHLKDKTGGGVTVRQSWPASCAFYPLEARDLEISNSNGWEDSGRKPDGHGFPRLMNGWQRNAYSNSPSVDAWLQPDLGKASSLSPSSQSEAVLLSVGEISPGWVSLLGSEAQRQQLLPQHRQPEPGRCCTRPLVASLECGHPPGWR